MDVNLMNCNRCGICNLTCPIYQVALSEVASSRFKAVLAKKGELSSVFFLCTLCSGCIAGCPAKVIVDCFQRRAELVKSGKEPRVNKVMRENIARHGNPFGDISKQKKVRQYYT
ncbi:MAG: (Fe-S)-binding protein [archaeon]